jgi:hypothetical protein
VFDRLFLKMVGIFTKTFAFSEACDHGGRSFSEMSQVVLVHPLQTFTVQGRLIIHKCDLFADNVGLLGSPYRVRSQVSLADFGQFVSALEGNAVTITNDNFTGLSALCDEFRFGDLGAALSQFRDSDDFKEAETIPDSEARKRLSALEEQMQQHDHEIASLQCELLRRSQAQESATEAILGRVSRLEADHVVVGSLLTEMTRLKELESVLSGEVEKVRNEVKKNRDALRGVRALAEGAQKKAESTEGQLGRVGRLEVEILSLKSGPVLPSPEPPAVVPVASTRPPAKQNSSGPVGSSPQKQNASLSQSPTATTSPLALPAHNSTPGSAAPPQQSTQGPSSRQISSSASPSTEVPPQKQNGASTGEASAQSSSINTSGQ